MSFIVIDVGGTNIRFGYAETEIAPLSEIKNLTCADFPSIEDAINAYFHTLPSNVISKITATCIAVAGPMMGDHVDVTNNHWQFSKSKLLTHLPGDDLLVINDFTAQALAQINPESTGNQPILQGNSRPDAPLLVIGPGTGLGVAALMPAHQNHAVIEGEGGHVYFTPRDDLEREIEAFLRKIHGFVSAEHVISGPGLEAIYQFLCHRDGVRHDNDTAAQIGFAAMNNDLRARQAVLVLFNALATVMANNILTMGCWRGAVIAGGIIPRLVPLFQESQFKERFCSAGVMSDILEKIPVWLATDPLTGLHGARNAIASSISMARIQI